MTTPLPLDHMDNRTRKRVDAPHSLSPNKSTGFFTCAGDLDNARRSLLAAFLHAAVKDDLTVRRFSLEEKDNRLELRYAVEGSEEARAFFSEVMEAAQKELG